MEGIHSTQSVASVASARSRAVPAPITPTPGSGTGVGAHGSKVKVKYQASKQIQVLHGLSLTIDLILAVILFSMLMSGSFELQMQQDGFCIVAAIAVMHILLHVPLLVALLKNWDYGFELFGSFGGPWIMASTIVFVYMIVDEVQHCKSENQTDRYQTRCFMPPIILFGFIAVQGILFHIFSRRLNLVNPEKTKQVTKSKSAHNLSMNAATTGTGGTQALRAGTLTHGIEVGMEKSLPTAGPSVASDVRSVKSLANKQKDGKSIHSVKSKSKVTAKKK